MSELICNAPFCLNSKNKQHGYCGSHMYERSKFKVKSYKELLPLWAVKNCKHHGYLRPSQALKKLNKNHYMCKLCSKRWRQPNPTTSKQARLNRQSTYLVKKYGITLDEYNLILLKQGNVCAICKKASFIFDSKSGVTRKMAVDHCHETLKVRGILCFKCNVGLGSFSDNIESLLNSIKYLQHHKDVQV